MSKPILPHAHFALVAAVIALAFSLFPHRGPAQTNLAKNQFEKEIHAFELSDRTNPPPQKAILFAGSSSFRKWTNLAGAFPKHQVINRGFGGSQIADVIEFADRIIIPCHPRLIVFYTGENDLAAGKTVERVLADFHAFVQKIHTRLPETRILFVSLKPSPSRWHLREQIQVVNKSVAAMSNPKLGFIDIYPSMLGEDGNPRSELFLADRLHMTEKGYEIWAKKIEPYLD